MRRLITTLAILAGAVAALATGPAAVLACAGLIGSNGAVNLGRTTTLAAYSDGVEHYVTAFQFQGGGGQFGTLIPLPGVPSNVERGGGWTLQRLALETQPPGLEEDALFARAASADGAEVLQQVRIDALDITILEGGGADVAVWAREHGFRLSPDAPEVLDFYARRSPIFMAAVFDGEAAAARGQQVGDGTPVHLTIPADNPWVPLRILALGKQSDDRVDADVYLLTDHQPALLPGPRSDADPASALAGVRGLTLAHSAPARDALLDDLRADDGMAWVPRSAWLTQVRVDGVASDIAYDLAVDASGGGRPSAVDAGIDLPGPTGGGIDISPLWAVLAAWLAGLAVVVALRLRPVMARLP
jgi:hypothetical protein